MKKRMCARRNLAGLVIAVAAAFCIAGGLALTAFAQPQPTSGGQDPAGEGAGLAVQSEGDVLYQYYDSGANDFQTSTKTSGEFTLVTQSSTTWGESEADAWYVVNGEDVQIGGRVTVSGTVNLILCDGAKLNTSQGITVSEGNTLNIYPGSTGDNIAGTGELIAGSSSDNYYAGIGGENGNEGDGGEVTIHGGAVTATGSSGAAGIGGGGGLDRGKGGTVAIYGGEVIATGGNNGAGIGGGVYMAGGAVTISGGTVTAKGGKQAAGIGGGSGGNGGSVAIYGGTVNATGGYEKLFETDDYAGAGIGGGSGGNGGSVAIYGGAVTATAGHELATGIGGGSPKNKVPTEPGTLTLGKGVTLYGGASADPTTVLTNESGAYAGSRYQYMKTTSVPSIRYQAWDSNSETVKTVADGILEYTSVESSTTSWDDTSNGGWYVVSGSVAVANRITVTGTVNLILCNDATLTASKGITVADGNTLNIYAQSTGENKGKLIAGASSEGCAAPDAGIGGSGGTGGTVAIHGGGVTAIGGGEAAGIGGGNGGAGGAITIYGGTVNTTGGEGAVGIGAGANATGGNGTLATPGIGVKMIISSDGNEWSLYGSDRARYMKTAASFSVALTGGEHATHSGGELTQAVTESQAMDEVTFTAEDGYHFTSFDEISNNGIKVTWIGETTVKVTGTPSGNASITIPDATQIPIPYQAWNGSAVNDVTGGCPSYTVVDANTTVLEDGKWYVVNDDVTVYERITVAGEANLILCDDASLTASKGITVNVAGTDNDGNNDNNILNVYAQSAGETKGELIAGSTVGNSVIAAENAGIGGVGGGYSDPATCGTVNIHGGAVTATGGSAASYGDNGGGAGVGGGFQGAGGTVTVYGGEVNANGGKYGAGIGSGNSDSGYDNEAGTVTIHGGTVTATGGNGAAGIGGGKDGSGGNVTIHGGTVNANGGEYGAGIGSGHDVTTGNGHVSGGTVNIQGGSVTAIGGSAASNGTIGGGAGIGGGNGGYGGTVNIGGGTVNATGGEQGGAGIGGGTQGNGGTVTVNGGTVTATSGERAAGIGGGIYGNGGTVTINGGTVKATGSVGVHNNNVIPGIGGGDSADADSLTTPGALNLDQNVALFGGDSSAEKALLAAEQGPYEGTRYKYMEITGADVQSVPYQAWDEESGTVKDVTPGRTSYTVVGADTTSFGNGKWYVVSSDAEVASRITVTGTAHLILCDGATLTASKGITVADGNTLNIYAQSAGEDKGRIIAGALSDGCDTWNAAIGGVSESDGGAVTIHGGTVTATGGASAAGIGGGSYGNGGAVTIHGGTVTATGGNGGAGIGGGAGYENAESGDYKGASGTVVINGGTVTATGGADAMGIGHGRGCSRNGTLTLADTVAKLVVSDDDLHWRAYSTTDDNRAQYMKPAGSVSVTLTAGEHMTASGGELEQTLTEGTSIAAVTFTADPGYVFAFDNQTIDGITIAKTDETTVTASGAPTTTTNIAIPDAVPAPIIYQAWDETAGSMKSVNLGSDYNVVDANTKKLAYDKPNVVSSNVTISDRIALQGESATLIICDDVTLTASQGIYVASKDTLNIHPGSTGESVEGTGTLTAIGAANMAGIGSNGDGGDGGTVVIHGGNVVATGGENAAGIGSGSGVSEGTVANRGCDVTVYGGTVKATGGTNSVGIGAGDNGTQHGTLTLNNMALYGGENAAANAMIIGSFNGVYGGNRYAYMEIGAAVEVDPILYKAWDEENQTVLNAAEKCTSYIAVNASTTTLGDGNWYVVSSDVAALGRITVDGTANVIICDDATLTARKGINITGATLNIYPGTTGDRVAGTGRLIAGASTGGCDDRVAAIGSDSVDNGGTLNIHGGVVTAIGGKEAAGIGGGYHCDGGTINIYSGTVKATGGEKAAGIGGGNNGSGGTIAIHNGSGTAADSTNVTATGGINAAGIGGGAAGDGGTVTIRNSDVTATGGANAAGIGGGAAGSGGTVDIRNSSVTATGGKGGAGIGGGSAGSGATVTIHSGTVITAAGLGAVGIGFGEGLDGGRGSLALGEGMALFGEDNSNPTVLAKKSIVQSVAYYELSRYMTAIDAVKGVEMVVGKLPAFDKVTTAHKALIANARTAYNELTADQKANVAADTLKKLEAAEDKLVILQAMSEVKAKTGSAVVYTGRPIQLINAPTTKLPTGYTMKYAVTTGSKAPTNESAYATSIPTATNAGTYYVWRKVVGSADNTAGGLASTSTTISKAPISKATVAAAAQVYAGKALTPAPTVKLGATTLKQGTDYTVSYKNNVKAGKATVTVTGKGNYAGTKAATFTINKAANKLTVKTAKKTVKASKKAQKVKCFKKAKPKFKAKVTYKKATTAKAKKLNGYKKKVLSVNKKTGKITVKKGTKAGTYKLMVKVTAAKTANTKAASKTVTVTVKVKGKVAKKSLKPQSARPADSSLRAASL